MIDFSKIIICLGIILMLVFVVATIINVPEPTRYGNNALLYSKEFNQCVKALGNIPRNVSTVEDDDSSDMIAECRYAALEADQCVYNGKECI